MQLTHLDLFSGIGGFALAARWAGFRTAYFCEKDAFCKKVLCKNFPGIPIFPDIKIIDSKAIGNKIDLLTAGFPCQPFSVAGKRKGKDDDRYLWPETMRVIRTTQPTWIILENVPGLIPHLEPILDDLENENYCYQSFLISASAVNAPHKRERLWIIANRYEFGRYHGGDHRQKRYLQDDIDGYLAQIQSEWTQFIPESWSTLSADEWLSINTDCSRVNDGFPLRIQQIKALGNAVVPQIPYLFMRMIQQIENVYD